MNAPPRVVLDTNVLVSALIFGGTGWRWLRAEWQEQRLLPLVSHATADELVRVLAYPKFTLTADERESLLADYLPWTEVVDIPDVLLDVPDVRDPNDRPFLCLALAGKADALVSGDDDLLSLRATWKRVPVMSVATFKQWHERQLRGSN
ncbi:MAG: putative toxin-antitoxin system toxin component, PIN family [Burkholderiaceae bacterium]|nr:MAG: putative toxin-antitoxin system toxin component, PIN family [Burkholderiaceae bacterium]